MSRGAGAPRRGDATPGRDEGALPAVAGVPCAGRSRYAGSSADAPARPPRSGDATGECRRTPTARRHGFISDLTEAAGMSRGAGAPRSGDATGELPQATDGMVSGYYPTLWRWQA